MITPIETKYKGYRFRSRLEARWAVFFDAIKLKWEYEKEGFDVNGIRYLPDFYFPTLETYAEVKPRTFTEEEFSLIASLRGLVLDGLPENKNYILAGKDCAVCVTENRTPEMNVLYETYLTICYQCYLANRGSDYWGIDLWTSRCKGALWFAFYQGIPDYSKAIEAALSARFEFMDTHP